VCGHDVHFEAGIHIPRTEGLSRLLCYNVSWSRDGDLPFLNKSSSLQIQRDEEDFTPWNLAHGLLKLQVQVSGCTKEGDGCKLQSECDTKVAKLNEIVREKRKEN